MLTEQLKKYARLLLTDGVNLQKNQVLFLNIDVESKDFALIVTQEAYDLGASEVVVNWRCQPILREKLKHASEETLATPAPWIPTYYKTYVDKKAAFLSLISSNPKALKNIDAKRISINSQGLNKVLSFYHEAIMGSAVTWCVAAVATPLWANILGYTGDDKERTEKLWQTIFTLCRLTTADNTEPFAEHLKTLAKRTKHMNTLNLEKLIYTCNNGTNLELKLPANHIWQGGREKSQDGIIFDANIPTEEVFCAPQRTGVNGIVYSTKPLIYQGNKINKFSLTFKNGEIIDYTAEEGLPYLKELIETDEGSHYLGEVALVDHYSPISASKMIFQETLFDENASCHLAIGAAYPTCLRGGEKLTKEELLVNGLNDSNAHVDFMIGHENMSIVGITKEGQKITIMDKGHLKI